MGISVLAIKSRAANPDRTAVAVFFLPDRDDLLETVDCVLARRERFRSVWAGDSDNHRIVAYVKAADTMLDRHRLDRPSRPGFSHDLV